MASGRVACKTHVIPLLAVSFSRADRKSSLMPIHAKEVLCAEDHAKWSKNKRFPFVTIVKLKCHLCYKAFSDYSGFPFLLRFSVDRCYAVGPSVVQTRSAFWFTNGSQCLHLCQLFVSKRCLSLPFLQDVKFRTLNIQGYDGSIWSWF